MTFFNKKTEVMKVELTPLGRYKLSIGKLKPHHYRFFDNNVVYDSNAIGLTEEQNDSDKRIRQETPVLKQNPNITGIETMVSIIETDDITVQMERFDPDNISMHSANLRKNKRDDHINQMVYNLGTVASNTENSPSYQVNAFRGKLSGSTTKFYSSQNIQTASIPQINLELEYEAQITNSFLDVVGADMDIQVIGPFQDGSRIIIKKQDPLIRIKESSAFDEKENFHITAYKVFRQDAVANQTIGSLIYEKMKFPLKQKKIVGDFYVDHEEDIEIPNPTPDNTSYFFDILVDKEIADEDYCETIGGLKVRNIYLDHEVICPDQDIIDPLNIYQTQVGPEDLEDCD